MTITMGTNASNDIYRGADGNLVLLTGLPAVSAACATASKAQLGEMVLAIKKGMPNFQALWIGAPNLPLWQKYLRKTLLAVNGVQKIQSLSVQQNGNTFSYTAQIVTIYGTVEVTG